MSEVLPAKNEIYPDLISQFARSRKELRSTAVAAIVAGLVFIISFFVSQRAAPDLLLMATVYISMLLCLFSSVRTIVSSIALKRLREASKQFDGAVVCTLEVEIRALPFNPGLTEVRVVNSVDKMLGNTGWMNFLPVGPVKESGPQFFVESKPITVNGRVDIASQQLLSIENDTIHLCRKY